MKTIKLIFTTSELTRSYLMMLLAYILLMLSAFFIATEIYVDKEALALGNAHSIYEDAFDAHLDILYSLDSLNVSSDEVTAAEFQSFVSGLDDETYPFEAVYFAPGGIVDFVYPASDALEYDGVDLISYFNDYVVSDDFSSMEAGKLITIQDRRQLQTSFILPLYKEDSFYGLVGVSLSETTMNAIFDSHVDEQYNTGILMGDQVLYGSTNKELKVVAIEDKAILDTQLFVYMNTNSDLLAKQLTIMLLYILAVSAFFTLSMYFVVGAWKKQNKLVASLNFQNDYDLVTKVFNHKKLFSDLEVMTSGNDEFFLAFGVFNNVKFIYNKFGKKIGEGIMIKSISRIKKILLNKNSFYRYGGDEYVIIFRNSNKGEVINILRKITTLFEDDIIIERARANVSMTFGITSFPKDGSTSEALINNAHITLSRAKGFMKNSFEFFEYENVTSEIYNQDFDDYISQLPLENFEVYLMPVIETDTNNISGFECLSRVKDQLGNNINIASVISSFERNGRILELDEYVFQKMISIKKLLNQKYDRDIFLSANCSALSLNERYVDTVIKLYEEASLTYGTIVVELTESYKVEDHDYLIKLFKRLNDAGIQIAIDDFGTGYSSLNYISKFPIYAIKIDKEYVKDFSDNEFNRTLMFTLISIAKAIKCKLVAEGVDEHETLQFLRNNGCPLYQGYLFSKGVPLDEALSLLDNQEE